ncbi:MAG TPA: amidohydrolase, partial [Thermoanaerobaculia bacterium]
LSLSAADRRATVAADVASMRDRLVECRRDFHMNPELSNREERTARTIADRLKWSGIPTRTGVAKFGVVATIEGGQPGRTVAVRADIDALPVEETIDVPYKSKNQGVKHACGHDAHAAIALGVAEILWKHRANLRGTVHVIFQPAEEGSPPGEEGGAKLMLDEGLFEKIRPAAIFGLHAMPSHEVGIVSFAPGAQMASSDRLKIVVRGKQSHGAAPHLGIDSIVVASQIILALQTIDSRRIDPVEPVVVTIGTIQGGARWNIVAESVELTGTVRTLLPEVRKETLQLVRSIASGIASAANATATVEMDVGIPVLMNDEKLSLWSEESLKNTVGNANVKRDPPRMIAEDFAYFAEKVPAFYFFLGVANREKGTTAGLHTPDFDIDERALEVGVNAMTNLVWDYLDAR